MPNASRRTIIRPRDLEILAALDRTPLTVEQLLKLSRTFLESFGSPSRVRGRLARLLAADWIRRWRYATAQRGAPADYYRLTAAGYRMLHGAEAPPPRRRHFAEIGLSRQHHTQCLAEFFVHTAVAAQKVGASLASYEGENRVRLNIDDEALYPDAAFRISAGNTSQYNFFVELDNGTERLTSEKSTDSIERKIAFYERYQNSLTTRLRVLFVTTRSAIRAEHIVRVANDLARNRKRRLIYVTSLARYLAADGPLGTPCFHDHEGLPVSLLPAASVRLQPSHNLFTRPMVAAKRGW